MFCATGLLTSVDEHEGNDTFELKGMEGMCSIKF